MVFPFQPSATTHPWSLLDLAAFALSKLCKRAGSNWTRPAPIRQKTAWSWIPTLFELNGFVKWFYHFSWPDVLKFSY